MIYKSKYHPWVIMVSALILFLLSCNKQEDWFLNVPEFKDNSILLNTKTLTDTASYAIEGIYKVTKGADAFGDTLVLKKNRDRISLFGYKNSCYFILGSGSKDSQIVLEGYWRYALNDRIGLARFAINNADQLIGGDSTLTNITIRRIQQWIDSA